MAELIAGQRAAAAADLETAVSVARVRVAQARRALNNAFGGTAEQWFAASREWYEAERELIDIAAQHYHELADAVARDAEGAGI